MFDIKKTTQQLQYKLSDNSVIFVKIGQQQNTQELYALSSPYTRRLLYLVS